MVVGDMSKYFSNEDLEKLRSLDDFFVSPCFYNTLCSDVIDGKLPEAIIEINNIQNTLYGYLSKLSSIKSKMEKIIEENNESKINNE